MCEIDKQRIIGLLEKWQSGDVTEIEMHEEVESIYEQNTWPQYPQEDHCSILVEVLSHLDVLNHQLVIKEDIQAIIDFLKTPAGQELEAWRVWKQYWNNIDYDERKELLNDMNDNPYYSI